MAGTITGGATSAVAASTHAGCERFRGTDPLITNRSRRALARQLGHADSYGGIPDARWVRALTFERLVRDPRFASEVATTAVGRLNLNRPTAVTIVDAATNVDRTADLLMAAHERAVRDGIATMIHGLAVPFIGFESERATDTKPDFAVVAPQVEAAGKSWLIIGDAKDYERVCSRIDDNRLLKGFLQVALGAECATHWSKLPAGQEVHRFGILAVPRNAFLQPEALVEDLDDHRGEVRMRVEERRREAANTTLSDESSLPTHVQHLRARFDPASCTTCNLFSYCRAELRSSSDPTDLLIEVGVPVNERVHLTDLVHGDLDAPKANQITKQRVLATLTGVAQRTDQRRTDQAGQPGTVNVVLAKSDSAALGVYGISVRSITNDGEEGWITRVFRAPQAKQTRLAVMGMIGAELKILMKDQTEQNETDPQPVHLVVPDRATADLLTSIADSLAGVELARIRWEHDLVQGREPLTFNGEPATIPDPLSDTQRLAVSFLLEEDRARAFTMRSPIVDVRAALATLFVVGGPASSAFRLDYLLAWARATAEHPIDHRALGDAIEAQEHTPGARLSNWRSNDIHHARVRVEDNARYEELVRDELSYKTGLVDQALRVLAGVPDSTLRAAHRALEANAQAVWRRRLQLKANDLVRFGRTNWFWRNSHVPLIETDLSCRTQLQTLGNPLEAFAAAQEAGNRTVFGARVASVDPLELIIDSRRISTGSRVVLAHVNGVAAVEGSGVAVQVLGTQFKITGLAAGPLTLTDEITKQFRWAPENRPSLNEGDELVLADSDWFSKSLKTTRQVNVKRPGADERSAPKSHCDANSYTADPENHQWCCRSHEVGEAEWSDSLAAQRERGELNPQVWPPVIDEDAFDVHGRDAAEAGDIVVAETTAPDDATMDELQ